MAEQRRAAYQFLPTTILETQQRASEASAWAERQRAAIAQQWADMHLADAQTTLGSLLGQQSTPAPEPAPAEMGTPEPPPTSGFGFEAAPPTPEPDLIQTAGRLGRLALPAMTGQYGQMGSPASQEDARALGQQAVDVNEQRRASARRVTAALAAGDSGEAQRALAESPMVDVALGVGGGGPEVVGRAGAGVASRVAGEVERLRLDKFPAAVRDTVEEAARSGDFWLGQRRGVIPDAEAERMADALGQSVDTMIAGGGLGKAYNTEETRALRNAVTGKALIVDDLRAAVDAAGAGATEAQRSALSVAERELSSLSRIVEGARAEAGRTFRAYLMDTRGRLSGRREDPTAWYRTPTEPGPVAPPAPGQASPAVTEQLPLITEPIAGKPREGFREQVYDRASLARIAGMVSGVPTHLLNTAGNAVMGGLTLAMKEGQIGADLARVGVGRALGKDVVRQRFQAEVGPQLEGYARGFWAGAQQIPGILAHGAPQDFHRLYDTRRLESGSKVLDTAVEGPLRALAASDAVFRGASFGGHSAALATRQATQEGLSGAARTQRAQEILGNLSSYPGLLESANKLAARDVFQESRGVTEAISKAKREHLGAQLAGDIVLPFYKTPYNVAAQGAGMTLPGYLSVLSAAKRGDTGEAVDRVVRATVGTMAMLGGLQLATSNLLTGAYPADAGDRSTLPEGWKPYSLRIPSGDGAVYVPIQALGAVAVPLGAAAVMVDAQRRGVQKGDPMKAVYAGLGGIGQFMGDMSALQGLNSVFKLVTAPERTVETFGENLAASFVPDSALARQVQQALGDAQRDPGNPLEAFMAGIPGLSQLVPEKQTPLGETRRRGEAGPIALVSGSRIGVEVPNTVTAALRTAGVGIPDAPKAVSEGTYKDIPLTEAEQREYRRIAGEQISQAVEAVLDHPDWAGASPAERAAELQATVEDARQEARAQLLERMGEKEAARRVARRPAA